VERGARGIKAVASDEWRETMNIGKILKSESPFAEAGEKLRAAIETGKVSRSDDAMRVIDKLFDSLDKVELTMALEESGGQGNELAARSAEDLLRLLDRLDAEAQNDRRI
jgi:hypothetical protein